MRYKRLLVFSTSAHVYGAERGLLLFLRWGIRKRFFSRAFVVIPRPGPLQQVLAANPDITCIVSPFPFTISGDFRNLLVVISMSPAMLVYSMYLIVRYRINAVISNTSCVSMSFPLALILPHIFFVREVVKNRFFCFVQRAISRVSCVTFTVSAYVQEQVRPQKSKVLQEPIDMFFFQRNWRRSSARAQLRIPAHYTVLAVIGRIHPAKGQKEFLQLLEQIPRSSMQRVVILIVGDESSVQYRLQVYKKDLLAQISASPHADSIRFAGYIQDMGLIYAAADVCIFPYQREEFYGYSILEALFFKKRVLLARPGGGISEYVRASMDLQVLNKQNLLKSLNVFKDIPITSARLPALRLYLHAMEEIFR